MIISNMFKRYDLVIVRYKFAIIYGLNVMDILFTLVLLGTGEFFEGNVLMEPIVANASASIALKVLLPIVLIYCLLRRMRDATERQLKISNIFINICLILYVAINISHISGLGLYLMGYL